jgi:hypothetical protein
LSRPTLAWHECLKVLAVPHDRPQEEMQKLFDAGKRAHWQIEARLHKIKDENARTFSDPALDFDIAYHADLWDLHNQVVYDIKPAVWLANNLEYCLAQLGGYAHFLGARAAGFAQYEHADGKVVGPWFTFVPKELLPPWDPTLRSIASASYQMLIEQEKVQGTTA